MQLYQLGKKDATIGDEEKTLEVKRKKRDAKCK